MGGGMGLRERHSQRENALRGLSDPFHGHSRDPQPGNLEDRLPAPQQEVTGGRGQSGGDAARLLHPEPRDRRSEQPPAHRVRSLLRDGGDLEVSGFTSPWLSLLLRGAEADEAPVEEEVIEYLETAGQKEGNAGEVCGAP